MGDGQVHATREVETGAGADKEAQEMMNAVNGMMGMFGGFGGPFGMGGLFGEPQPRPDPIAELLGLGHGFNGYGQRHRHHPAHEVLGLRDAMHGAGHHQRQRHHHHAGPQIVSLGELLEAIAGPPTMEVVEIPAGIFGGAPHGHNHGHGDHHHNHDHAPSGT